MSATADTARYKDYFKDLGRGERVEVLAIPSSNNRSFFQKKVLYLEQVIFHGLLYYNMSIICSKSSVILVLFCECGCVSSPK